MRGFQEILENYGVDYKGTMARFMGNESFYLRMLGLLSSDESFRNLGSALENGNLDGAFEAAHTLKGVAGNLGLTPLYRSVCAVVEPLRIREERDDYADFYQAIRNEYEKVEQMRQELTGGN